MPKEYDWEWLKRDPSRLSEDPEADDRQVRELRRWVDAKPGEEKPPTEPGTAQRRTRNRFFRQAEERPQPEAKSAPASDPPTRSPEERSPRSLEPPVTTAKPPTDKSQSQGSAKGHMPKKKDDYREQLKQEFTNLFEGLELEKRQTHYLKARWLDQVLWMEGRASKARDRYYQLRLTTIIGGVIIPALVSLNFLGSDNKEIKQAIAISTFVLSQVVAISAATEQFFNYGERWRHYRRSVESLKTNGWQFFELSGPYQTYTTHQEAFSSFAGEVEQILQKDVEVYASQVTQVKQEDKPKDAIPQTISNDSINDMPVTPSVTR